MLQMKLSVTILIAYLKHYGVRRIVLSPGTRNILFITSVENDPFFTCYSAVDERNAAFFALGIAQQTGEPVAAACTSGTAVSNFLSGMTEAYYSHAKVVAITSDRSAYVLNQLETQKVDQVGALKTAARYSAQLPVLKDHEDIWYFERLLNEAFISMNRGAGGPIHINLPLVSGESRLGEMEVSLPTDFEHAKHGNFHELKFIDFIEETNAEGWARYSECLSETSRVLIVLGQRSHGDVLFNSALSAFAAKYRIPILADGLSNFHCPEFIAAEAVVKGLTTESFRGLQPDIVISVGLNFQERVKDLFKTSSGCIRHWSVDPDGEIRDCFRRETAVFACEPQHFFERMIKANVGSRSNAYLSMWKAVAKTVRLPNLEYGNFMAVAEFATVLPKNSVLHLSIQNATRLMQFFPIDSSVSVFANVNAFGIDGCLPTFMGQAVATEHPAFLVIGDLSCFYAMNALAIRCRKNNVHIMVLNNHGAAEFHIPATSNALPTLDRFIGVSHAMSVRGWAESIGYEYLSAENETELKANMPIFVRPANERPIVFEVFSDMKSDGEQCLSVYHYLEGLVSNAV